MFGDPPTAAPRAPAWPPACRMRGVSFLAALADFLLPPSLSAPSPPCPCCLGLRADTQGHGSPVPFYAETIEVNRESAGLLVAGLPRWMVHPDVGQSTTCTAVPGSPGSFPSSAWPVSSAAHSATSGVNDRKTQKLSKDVGAGQVLENTAPRPLGRSGSILGILAPIQQPRHLLCKHSGPHTQWFPTAGTGQPDPSSTPSPPPLSFPLWGTVLRAAGRGPRLAPFLPGRKGLLGGLGMLGEHEWHANEMLMSLGWASPESGSSEPPPPQPRETGRPAPSPPPHLWAENCLWVEGAALWPPSPQSGTPS